ncbi:MAG: glycosyltransferase family 2 protein [Acidimicrobiales bacterium]
MPFLPEILESICSQSFADFELLVCDNASTDATEEIVRELAGKDRRVRYVRFDSDAGASANFNRCFEGTGGALFTWAASDDRFCRDYLRSSVDYLSEHPEHAMCVPDVELIDEAGTVTGLIVQPTALGSSDLAVRLGAYLDRRSWYMVYGLARRTALAETGLFPARFGADVILMWNLLLRRTVGNVGEALLQYRRYAVKTTDVVWRGIQATGSRQAPRFLHARMYRDLLAQCDQQDLAARRAGRRALAAWLVSQPFRDLLVDDMCDELRRPDRSSNRLYEAGLLVSVALLRPSRALRNALRLATEPERGVPPGSHSQLLG